MIFCLSVSAVRILVRTLIPGGDTQTVTAIMKFS